MSSKKIGDQMMILFRKKIDTVQHHWLSNISVPVGSQEVMGRIHSWQLLIGHTFDRPENNRQTRKVGLFLHVKQLNMNALHYNMQFSWLSQTNTVWGTLLDKSVYFLLRETVHHVCCWAVYMKNEPQVDDHAQKSDNSKKQEQGSDILSSRVEWKSI